MSSLFDVPVPAIGPGAPYQLLFDDDDRSGPGLPPEIQAIYGGDWRIAPAPADRPLVVTNFVASHDGRISFDLPKHSGGGSVSRGVPHDTWLMGLIRARADAILTGGGTLRVARKHRWTPATVFPAAAETYAALRRAERKAVFPLLVVLSKRGDLPADAQALASPDQPVLIATTAAGAQQLRASLGPRPQIDYFVSQGDTVDLRALLQSLRRRNGVQHLLSEGGARVYGALIAAGLIDETFLTLSPIVVGNPPTPAAPRTSLVEGVAFEPDDPPRFRLISLRRHGDYLFQRVRFSS
ncbi:MAG: deaminase [Oscillochloris sp.]|nr:deaminase [Oscillochloris sp.]